jgi:hypothetical protein
VRDSANVNDFSLVAMLGLLGPRIFEATGLDIGDMARNTATGYCGCSARAARPSSSRCRQWSAEQSTALPMPAPRARTNLDRHPNYVLAAFMASGT